MQLSTFTNYIDQRFLIAMAVSLLIVIVMYFCFTVNKLTLLALFFISTTGIVIDNYAVDYCAKPKEE